MNRVPGHNVGKLPRIDIATRQNDCGRPGQLDLFRDDGGMADSGSALGNKPIFVEQGTHAVIDLAFGKQYHLVNHVAADVERMLVAEPDTAPQRIGERCNFAHLDGFACIEARGHCSAAIHADAYDPNLRLHGFCGDRNTRDKPSARQRHKERFNFRVLIENLEGYRSLSGNDIKMIEGRNLGYTLVSDKPIDLPLGVIL